MFILQKIEGVAQLLFEMMKGVKDRFHSCSEEVSTVPIFQENRAFWCFQKCLS
jgi:hypothetical protein